MLKNSGNVQGYVHTFELFCILYIESFLSEKSISYKRRLQKSDNIFCLGLLKISDLQNQIFHGEKRFPSSHVLKYVDLMSKFEVGIKISDKYLLIPSLLPDKQKQCPVVADHEFPELRKAMNVHAYLNHRVYRRLYLMTYVPTGFWARLLTR